MAAYGEDNSMNKGYNSVTDAVGVTTRYVDETSSTTYSVSSTYLGSLYLTVILGVINFLGYCTIACFLGITEIPIITKAIDATRCVGIESMA